MVIENVLPPTILNYRPHCDHLNVVIEDIDIMNAKRGVVIMSEEKVTTQNINTESYLLSVVLLTGASTFINKIQQMPSSTKPGEVRKIMQIYMKHLEELYKQTS